MDRTQRWLRGQWPAASLALAVGFAWGCGSGDVDRRIAAKPGGAVTIDIELGSGISFDRGSLEVGSHASDEIRIVADVSGWGGYAVAVDVYETEDPIRIVGRVDGALHWMFGGPTVDFRIVVPQDFRVGAHIDGGDLRLEDLVGAVDARVDGSQIVLARSEGDLQLASGGGEVRVEDVEGSLRVDSAGGDVAVSGVHGRIEIASEDGRVQLASATGRADIESDHGRIEVANLRGDLRVRSARGRISIADVEGDVDAETERGRIEIAEHSGSVRARSERGGIDVAFVAPAAGAIDTSRGSIRVEVPSRFGFDLDAATGRGQIELDRQFAFEPFDVAPDVAAEGDPVLRDLEQMGLRVAAEIRKRAAEQLDELQQAVQQNVEQWRRTGDFGWEPGPNFERWSKPWPWDDPHWRDWPDADARFRERAHHAAGHGFVPVSTGDARKLEGRINGGGTLLRIRTERGSIRIVD